MITAFWFHRDSEFRYGATAHSQRLAEKMLHAHGYPVRGAHRPGCCWGSHDRPLPEPPAAKLWANRGKRRLVCSSQSMAGFGHKLTVASSGLNAHNETFQFMTIVAMLFQWLWAPIITAGVSFIYLQNAKNERKYERIAVSSHGFTLALVYFGALGINVFGIARPSLGIPFWVTLLLPAALAVFALARFEGNRAIHLLQLGNLLAASWIFSFGTMAVTGNWL